MREIFGRGINMELVLDPLISFNVKRKKKHIKLMQKISDTIHGKEMARFFLLWNIHDYEYYGDMRNVDQIPRSYIGSVQWNYDDYIKAGFDSHQYCERLLDL